jgi:hypothetical protein
MFLDNYMKSLEPDLTVKLNYKLKVFAAGDKDRIEYNYKGIRDKDRIE